MFKIFLTAMILLFMQASAQAYGIFWYDMSSDIPLWKKVVIFPLANSNDKNNYLISRDENSLLYFQNKWLMNRFEKKIKNMHTVRLAPGIKEKDEILVDKFSVLLQPYPTEKARAVAVFEQTGADMYIMPRFRENKLEKVVSPRTEIEIEVSSWTEIVGSKDRDGIYDKKTWKETHVIPQHEYYVRVTNLEFEGYDIEGNKVFLFNDARRDSALNLNIFDKSYAETQFRDIIYYLRLDFANIKSEKHRNKIKKGVANVGFKELKLPPEITDDEYALKGAYCRMKFEAIDMLKDVNVIINDNETEHLDYYITGGIDKWEHVKKWIPPTVVKFGSVIVSEEESEWRDGFIKRKMYTRQCRDNFYDNSGYWSVYWKVQASFQLVNASTGEVVVSFGRSNDVTSPTDAYRSILRDFYKQVNKYFGK